MGIDGLERRTSYYQSTKELISDDIRNVEIIIQ